MTELERQSKVMVFCMYYMENLIDKNSLEGPKMLTSEGKTQAEELIEGGFQPTDEEMQSTLRYLSSDQFSRDLNEMIDENEQS